MKNVKTKTYTVSYFYLLETMKIGCLEIDANSETEAREKAEEMEADGELLQRVKNTEVLESKFNIESIKECQN